MSKFKQRYVFEIYISTLQNKYLKRFPPKLTDLYSYLQITGLVMSGVHIKKYILLAIFQYVNNVV